ncbi:hypothetical protein Ait01nite_067840 [Actinoplanes italicus]|uniref:Uncharacterized protein n=1 Tax=Actinoplanes italicus TaxID=113567 RepID=A0A2T0K166_9ACTN|nr:hypothetical protein [Actinoplanes italicus]PRX16534.1 hypothetical protein CLV67_119115 [Actinoplanes italicus]GIE33739.1 hypothetical protein Ait01nite_067840 [Actinoplanes italicus]
MTVTRSRRSVPDRARRRAIRALAAQLGVAYSVAARLLEQQTRASLPHPSLPHPVDEHRAWMFAAREQRTFHSRVTDTRLAVDLPLGRAAHLVRRFPPMRATGGAGPLYAGDGRETVLSMLYAVLLHESPHRLPPRDELAWAAELGEETAVDFTCSDLDRAARLLLDQERWRLWARVDAALTAASNGTDRHLRDAAVTLGRELRSTSLRGSLDGARQTLDAVLVSTFGGDAPGTRTPTGIVTAVTWSSDGPPTGHEVATSDNVGAL